MKINILNRLIVDPETIDRIEQISEKESRKTYKYGIYFIFKDGSTYTITYGVISKKDEDAKERITAEMGRDMESIHHQILNKTEK